jgi:DNA-directed RNA polymerase subunit beta
MPVKVKQIRNYAKVGDAMPVPNLIKLQTEAYKRFLQVGREPDARLNDGLEALLREVFPIESYDQKLRLEYMHYDLGKARYTPDECRQLRLTYGMPFRIICKLTGNRDIMPEDKIEEVYLGELPIMLGGGEFIINGAERVIVSQLHRSPGVDFVTETQEGDRKLHGFRIIPERGSWLEAAVSKKETLDVRIDQSSKISAATFLRSMDVKYSSTESIIREFYKTKEVKVADLAAEHYAVGAIVNPATGEEVVKAGSQIGGALELIRAGGLTRVEVVDPGNGVLDTLMLNSLSADSAENTDSALMKIYARLRPGNPVNLQKAKDLFKDKFYDVNRYRLGRVGRFRINRKFGQNVPETEMILRPEDFINAIKYLYRLRAGEGHEDDIDHLGNRRLRTIDELAADELRKGFLKLRRTVQERMSLKDPKEISPRTLINSKSVSSSVDFFFGRGELSQVVDQTNPLAQLTHERRLSALGPGGLNRKRAGFEVRDVHISHYGRICPIETPEGTNIGLIASLSIYADVDDYGFLITSYRTVEKGRLKQEGGKDVIRALRADEEMEGVLAPADLLQSAKGGQIIGDTVLARLKGDLGQCSPRDIQYVDISPKQPVGVSASLIPFLEHDDANRALMGSNMQRQAVPLLTTEPPVVGTGMEKAVAENSGMVVRATRGGKVTYVDARKIVVDDADEYVLRKFAGLNERTCLNQRPIVRIGQEVAAGQVIADGPATKNGELALGRNLLVAFMTFDGFNFEDAILISERLVKDDRLTSIHIDEFEIEIRETKLGKEEFTRDIPNVSEKALRNLDERGVVQIGTRVGPGDILVGKVAPKSKSELSPEEKLLLAIFGRQGEDVKNDSLEVPAGVEGIVIDTKRFIRKTHLPEDERKRQAREQKEFEDRINNEVIRLFKRMGEEINAVTESVMVDPETKQKVGLSPIAEVLLEQVEKFTLDWVRSPRKDGAKRAEEVYRRFWPRIENLREEKERKLAQMKRGDELPSGVLEMVKVYIATKRHISVGDKMAGRHGNKGVIARIMPEEDMPFLEDGTPVDIVLNPLGVPSRMNIGQILETHLGWAAGVLGFQALTPVFDGAKEDEIWGAIEEANAYVRNRKKELDEKKFAPAQDELLVEQPERTGKVVLYDGRTGEPFEQRVTVGLIYMMKLHHLVDDKIHARATGPYSLITQQPLGGKARTGGQRFGEMECWALEAYGAAYTLQELLTVKSDDVEGRTKIYESMVKGTNTLEAGTPVSFDVLCNEIRGLGLNIQLEKKKLL